MKKYIVTSFIILIFHSFIKADLIDVYKRGEITIIPDPEFGADTNWDTLFREVDRWLAFPPDGTFFRSSSRGNKIYKFSKKGDLLFEFGQHGQEPGDLNFPGELSILDGKYLVVKEYALSRRISTFDLDGKYVKLLKINYHANSCISLKDNKIAIVAGEFGPGNRKAAIAKTANVFIKDISNEKEVKVVSFKQEKRRSKLNAPQFYGSVNISKIDNDKLLVGFSKIPEICIYSLNEKKLSSFRINSERKKVEKSVIDRFLDEVINNQRTDRQKEIIRQYIKNYIDKIFFPEFLTYYYKIAVDTEDNIHVFLNNWIDNSEVIFQVYSKDGQYICTTKVNSGNFEYVYPTIFYKNFFYSRFGQKEGDDFAFLAKIKLN